VAAEPPHTKGSKVLATVIVCNLYGVMSFGEINEKSLWLPPVLRWILFSLLMSIF